MVTDKITEALATGQLKPGEYLPSENQLSENLGVGKSSIREAIKMLEQSRRRNCKRTRQPYPYFY